MGYSFELWRIFIGENLHFLQLFEIIFRTTFMYCYTVLNVRLMDKRSMGHISSFEIIIIIALGTSVGDSMLYQVPLLQAMIAITTIVFVEKTLTRLAEKNELLEKFIVGKPRLIIHEGNLLEDELERQSLSKGELNSFLRLKGVSNIGDIEYAFLEPTGGISVILFDKKKNNGKSTLPNEVKRLH